MSNTLDDKLDYILKSNAAVQVNFDEFSANDYDKLIPAINQAFTDEGYVQVPLEVQETWRSYNHMAGYMTGQEFYDRFEKLANDIQPFTPVDSPRLLALELAKRAAGLEPRV